MLAGIFTGGPPPKGGHSMFVAARTFLCILALPHYTMRRQANQGGDGQNRGCRIQNLCIFLLSLSLFQSFAVTEECFPPPPLRGPPSPPGKALKADLR